MFMRLAGVIALALMLDGCAAVGLAVVGAGAGAGMGAGVEHTLNGITYKTFTAPVSDMRNATLKTMDRMRMPVKTDEPTDEGWKLSAEAADRTIDIQLQRLTDGVTRMRVVVNQGQIFFKDSSTATEIVLQTGVTLASNAAAARPTASPAAKKKGSPS
jgi:hypothetical protein